MLEDNIYKLISLELSKIEFELIKITNKNKRIIKAKI